MRKKEADTDGNAFKSLLRDRTAEKDLLLLSPSIFVLREANRVVWEKTAGGRQPELEAASPSEDRRGASAYLRNSSENKRRQHRAIGSKSLIY